MYNDNNYFYMLTPFSFSNSGHNLSIMLDFLCYITENNIKNILIYKNYKNTNNFKLINLLLPNDSNIIELELNTIYKIKNIIIIHPEFYNIFKHRDYISKIINITITTYSEMYKKFT